MPTAPESLVYRGVEGTGAAQIFGREGDPLKAYHLRRNDIAKRQQIAAEEARLKKEKRDKKMWELINVSPDKAYQPFNRQIIDMAGQHRNNITTYLENGGDPDNPRFLQQVKTGWDTINDQSAKSNYIKSKLDEAIKRINESPYQKDNLQTYYLPKLNDIWMDENGNARPLEEISTDQFDAILNDPAGYNLDKYATEFVANPKETIVGWVKKRNTNLGLEYDDYKLSHTPFFTPDARTRSGVVEDEQGNPVINVDNDVINAFVDGSDIRRQAIEMAAEKEGISPQEFVRNIITEKVKKQGGGFKLDVTPHFSRDPQWYYNQAPGLKPNEAQLASKIWENTSNIVNAFVRDGGHVNDASPEARASVGHFKGMKFGSGFISEAQLVPGTNKPGQSEIMGMKIENSPNDRLVFKVKSGTRGITKPEEIDLTDEGAGTTIYELLNGSDYTGGKKIPFDVAAEQLNFNPQKLYSGREYVGLNRIKEQETLSKWVEGTGEKEIVGKTYQGNKILSVKRETERTFRHPIDGEFTGYKLKLSNGKEVTISKDDYDSLTEIYRSKEVAGDKKTGITWE